MFNSKDSDDECFSYSDYTGNSDDYGDSDDSDNSDENENNHSKVWTKDDDKHLLKLVLLDNDYNVIAFYLKRTEDAIKARIVKTIICKKYTKKLLNENMYIICKTFDIKRDEMIRYIKYVIPSFELKETVKRRIDFI